MSMANRARLVMRRHRIDGSPTRHRGRRSRHAHARSCPCRHRLDDVGERKTTSPPFNLGQGHDGRPQAAAPLTKLPTPPAITAHAGDSERIRVLGHLWSSKLAAAARSERREGISPAGAAALVLPRGSGPRSDSRARSEIYTRADGYDVGPRHVFASAGRAGAVAGDRAPLATSSGYAPFSAARPEQLGVPGERPAGGRSSLPWPRLRFG